MSTITEQCVQHVNRGKVFFQNRQYEQALQQFNSAIALVALFPQTYLDRGATFQVLGNSEQALNDLNIAIALFSPDDALSAMARHNRATVQESRGYLVAAIADFERATQQGLPQAAAGLQRLRERHGAVEIDVNVLYQSALTMCQQGKAAVMNRRFLEGLGLFHYASEQCPKLPEAFHGMGVANVSLKRFDAAISAFAQVIELDESTPGMVAESLFNRSSLLFNKGARDAGISDLERCLAMCHDQTVSFPCFGDPDKEMAFIQGIENKLTDLLRSS